MVKYLTALLLMTTAATAGEQRGIASIFCGNPTASGRHMSCSSMVAAHKTLPFGTSVTVTHGSRSVMVRIIDRGPFIRGRVIDLSPAAGRAIGIDGIGAVVLKW